MDIPDTMYEIQDRSTMQNVNRNGEIREVEMESGEATAL